MKAIQPSTVVDQPSGSSTVFYYTDSADQNQDQVLLVFASFQGESSNESNKPITQ